MAAKSRWLAYALCCAFIAACGGNDDNTDTTATPTLSQISNQTTNQDTATAAIPFTVADTDTSVSTLTVSGTSSNTTLVPNANIVFGGSGANRTVTITPAAGQTGTATITYAVSDGTHTANHTFTLTVAASSAKTFDTPTEGAQLAAALSSLFTKVGGTAPAGKSMKPKVATPCAGGGTVDFAGDDTTQFAGDGTFTFSDCVNTDQDSGDTTTLDGLFALKCTDSAQDQSTCNANDSDITLGQAQTPLTGHIVNAPLDLTGDFYSFVLSLTDNDDQQTDSLSVNGRVVVADNSTSSCGNGDITIETVEPLTVAQSDQSQITGGELNLTAADESAANVVFHADGSATVTVDDVGQNYTAAQLATICSGG